MMLGTDQVQSTVPATAVAEARAFYCGLLGLREVEKPATLRGLASGSRSVTARSNPPAAGASPASLKITPWPVHYAQPGHRQRITSGG
jgi:hypothetical protein